MNTKERSVKNPLRKKASTIMNGLPLLRGMFIVPEIPEDMIEFDPELSGTQFEDGGFKREEVIFT